MYVAVAAGVTFSFPEVLFAPLHPFDAVQEEVFVEDHVSADDAPSVIVVGFAVKVRVAAGGGVSPHFDGSISGLKSRPMSEFWRSHNRLVSESPTLAARATNGTVAHTTNRVTKLTNKLTEKDVTLFPIECEKIYAIPRSHLLMTKVYAAIHEGVVKKIKTCGQLGNSQKL